MKNRRSTMHFLTGLALAMICFAPVAAQALDTAGDVKGRVTLPGQVAPQNLVDDTKGTVSSASLRPIVKLLDTFNGGGVANNPTAPTVLTLGRTSIVTKVQTYHWNNGRGTPAPGTIQLIGPDGRVYGPWRATGLPGSGGVPNAFWDANPGVSLAAGRYTVVDSDKLTWSKNAQSGNAGFTLVMGR